MDLTEKAYVCNSFSQHISKQILFPMNNQDIKETRNRNPLGVLIVQHSSSFWEFISLIGRTSTNSLKHYRDLIFPANLSLNIITFSNTLSNWINKYFLVNMVTHILSILILL